MPEFGWTTNPVPQDHYNYLENSGIYERKYGYSPNAIYHDYYIQITKDSDEQEDFLLDVYNQVKGDKVG